MPLLRWLARLFRATVWLAVHVFVGTGLFVLSAYLLTQPGTDEHNVARVVRGLGAVWLFLAAWHFVVRGVFSRAQPPHDPNRKVSAAEAARGSLGCLAGLAGVAATYVHVGRLADWAYAGIQGKDARHPAQRLLEPLLALLERGADRPDVYGPYVAGGLVALAVLYAVASRIIAPASTRGGKPRSASAPSTGPAPAFPGKRKRRRDIAPARRPDIADANEVALAMATRTARAATATAGAVAVGAAHAGAHRKAPVPPHPAHVFASANADSGSGRAGREDVVLGALTWSSTDGAWWARRDEGFPVRIEATADGPTTRQIDVARTVVQRSFELLLRGSEAARGAAQARGVGLPRFTIAAATVGHDDTRPPVVLHLRCDGDASTDYAVTSIDGLQTFKTG